MIKIEHVVLPSPEQMEFVIEGMRNPMNSWDKSDTCVRICRTGFHEDRPCDPECAHPNCSGPYINKNIGDNDFALMKRLSAAGTDHRKFMRMMPVMIRITAPLYWWKEFDTYKVGTVANSCSTMHKITEKEFEWSDFSVEKLKNFGCVYDEGGFNEAYAGIGQAKVMGLILLSLNGARERYLDLISRGSSYNQQAKEVWWQIIQLLPSSYNQTRNVMLNYEVLANIYKSRKNHKLDEWVEFCKWIEELPYSELITGKER